MSGFKILHSLNMGGESNLHPTPMSCLLPIGNNEHPFNISVVKELCVTNGCCILKCLLASLLCLRMVSSYWTPQLVHTDNFIFLCLLNSWISESLYSYSLSYFHGARSMGDGPSLMDSLHGFDLDSYSLTFINGAHVSFWIYWSLMV